MLSNKTRKSLGLSLWIAVGGLTITSNSNAGLLIDPGFDAAGIEIGDTIVNPITSLATGTWLSGGHDNNQDDWDIVGGVASNDGAGSEAQGLLQWFVDGKTTTGAGVFSFDVLMSPGQGDFDLYAYVFGWDAGAPGVDFENGSASTGDSFTPNSSTSLISEITGPEGRLVIANNGAASFGGASTSGVFETVTASIDFGAGYDNIGVLFYAENSGGRLELDNVQLHQVPAPAPLALLGLGLAFLSGRLHKNR